MLKRLFKVLTIPLALLAWLILYFTTPFISSITYIVYGKGIDHYLNWLFNTSQRYEEWFGE